MDLIGKIKKYKLKLKEKFNNLSYRHFIRVIKMILKYPTESIKNGVLKFMINLTYRCQCNCDYCWCGSYDCFPDKELDSLEVKKLLNEIAGYPSIFTLVSFVGGEPLLREDVYELINYATKKGLFTEMETNGILLSSSTILKLKHAGLNHLFVRIEGSNPKIHDSISKIKGCFERAVEGIKICIKEKLSCSIFTNAHREKIKNSEIKKIVDLGKQLKVRSIRIIYPTLAGKWINAKEQKLHPKEKDMIKKFLQPGFTYLESTDALGKEDERFCPAYRKKFFHISCYGEVQPCPFVPLTFGNIKFQSLKEILKFMKTHPLFEKKYKGCLINNEDFRREYGLLPQLTLSYRNIEIKKMM